MNDPSPQLTDTIADALAGWWPEYIGPHEGWECGCNERGTGHPEGLPTMTAMTRHLAGHILALAAMTSQTPQDAPQAPHTTQPVPECPPASIAPQTGTQGRDRWADGYAAAKRFYGDTAPIALDKIRERIDQYRDEHGHRPPPMFDLDNLLEDLQDILDTAQEPHA